MDVIGLTEILIIGSICIIAAFAAVWFLLRASEKTMAVRNDGFEAANTTCFLFEGERLVDATVSAYGLLGTTKPGQTNWSRIREIMAPRFPGFPTFTEVSDATGHLIAPAEGSDDNGQVLTEWWDGMIRVELVEQHDNETTNQHKLALLQHELTTLRIAVKDAPYPVWQTDGAGKAIWTNAAYDTLHEEVITNQAIEEDTQIRLFDLNCVDGVDVTRSRTALNTIRSENQHWYDVSIVRNGDTCMNYAIDVNAVVNAEIAQRNFVQTLTKTFAHLSIGLAIFDRNRQLALFNPALIDLTALPADFLSIRPNLLSFFDRLRDNRMMPEPKNYSSWREQIADLVAAATDGRYFETWTLESGMTYRVSGRPHPDGAIAFLFEDISAEISLAQRFRAQHELGQTVLDDIEEAIAVFSAAGVLTLSNIAFQKLWDIDPDSSFAAMTISDVAQRWRDNCENPSEWKQLNDYALEYEERVHRKIQVTLRDGKTYRCEMSPLSGGNTSIKFRVVPVEQAAKITSPAD